MRIVRETEKGYAVACDCPNEFSTGRMRMTFECPHCGTTAFVSELVCNWVSENSKNSR